MKKSSVSKKLILSCTALGATILCLTSTTYAWFAKNANAWTEDFDVTVKKEEGLKVSIDGVNFYDTVDKEMLSKAILSKRLNKPVSELTSDEAGLIIEFKPVSTNDLETFTIVNSDSKIENGYYQPSEANKAAYIEFDLYFRAISSAQGAPAYSLIFANDALADKPEEELHGAKRMSVSYITSTSSTVKLNNQLIIPTYKDTRENPTGIYTSGEEITINPQNAMRIGVLHHETSKTVYEPNMGYGSAALADAPDSAYSSSEQAALYDPACNPMITYFNNTHNLGKLAPASYNSFYVNTLKDFEGKQSLGEFTKGEDGTYNDVKVTLFLWLEGYDADYLEGVDTSSIHFFLNFTKVEG